jgi:serine/threonine protein kinase
MGRTAAQEAAFANRMLAKADQYLAAVDDAFILTSTNHVARAMPTFRPQEVSLGRELGHGGFGVVFAISNFTLDEEVEEKDEAAAEEGGAENAPPSTGPPSSAGQPDASMTQSGQLSEMEDTEHYAIDKARHVMEHRVLRREKPRYALKMLHADLSQVERARGMIDLALEAKYLSIVWHPNISTLIQCRFYWTSDDT